MTTPTPDNAASATPVAYLTGDERAKPCVTRADFGGDDALMHETAKEMRWVPLVPASTVTALEARVAELEANDRRYRFLRDGDGESDWQDAYESIGSAFVPEHIDSLIDTAIERHGAGAK